jgi:outer membrane receptor protein involved in Fe transport
MSIAGDIPGLAIQDLGPGDKRYVIRGIYSPGDSTTGVYYGEAVITQGNSDDGGGFQPDIRLYDLDHVEVLRGPQGTLYGASSMSGTIRYIPKSPDMDKVDGYINLQDSWTAHASNNYNANGALNLPIVDGVLALRLVGWKIYDSGYVDQIRVGTGVTGSATGLPSAAQGFVKGVNDDDVAGGRAILRYQPIQSLTIDLDYTTQSETSAGSSRWTPAGVTAFNTQDLKPPLTPSDTIPRIQGCDLCNTDVTRSPWSDDIKVFGGTVTWDTGHGTVTATDHQFNRNTGFQFDSTPILVSFGVPIPAQTLEPRALRVNAAELRYASAFDFPVNFVAGAYRNQSAQDLAVEVVKTNGLGYPNGPFVPGTTADDALSDPDGNTFFGRTDHRTSIQWAGFGGEPGRSPTVSPPSRHPLLHRDPERFQVQTHPFGGFSPRRPACRFTTRNSSSTR